MGDMESELAIFWNQERPQVENWDTNITIKPSTDSFSCLQSVLGPEFSRILIKETRETSRSNWW